MDASTPHPLTVHVPMRQPSATPVRTIRAPSNRFSPYQTHGHSPNSSGTQLRSTPGPRTNLDKNTSPQVDDRTPSSTSCRSSPPPSSSVRLPWDLDHRIDAAQLASKRADIHRYATMDSDDQSIESHMSSLHLGTRLDLVESKLDTLIELISGVSELQNKTWEPTEDQMKNINELIWHYMIQANGTFGKISVYIQSYIVRHKENLNLQAYTENAIIQTRLNKIIDYRVGQIKSAYHKDIKGGLMKKKPLRVFAMQMIQDHHLPTRPTEPPRSMLATHALLRYIEFSKSKGGRDYWKIVEKELDLVYSKLRQFPRNHAMWASWEDEIIERDEGLFAAPPPLPLPPLPDALGLAGQVSPQIQGAAEEGHQQPQAMDCGEQPDPDVVTSVDQGAGGDWAH
ncbi:hypothetical protein NLI96_g4298 [Meripilus lineatus]|uniref:Uncharacterized protein n=1 Tax=Meripilus lineatus TaxID=2056292 RepID=A0AAD5V6U0_9APHY|nr:hypothetical protein NLI96_g4298 [Physisporinus lineatus]